MKTLSDWFDSQPPEEGITAPANTDQQLDEAIRGHLAAAGTAAQANSRWWDMKNGAIIERAMSNLDAAEALLLRRAPAQYLAGQVPHFWAHIRQHLPADDPRRLQVQPLAEGTGSGPLDGNHKELLIQGVRAASSEARREFTRVRSFRNALLATAVLLTLIAAAVAIWGFVRPDDLQICFEAPAPAPPDVPSGTGEVCPAGDTPLPTDIFLLEFIGMVAGAVSGSLALRHLSGTSTRLGLPVALAVLKLPTGALTAFLGLILMRGEFVPGLSNLDSSAQILAWAVVFGAAQQLVTGLIDRQAATVISQIGGKANQVTAAARP
ncbi:hypothetical protein GCM10023081_25090 [Arthrobacter ginkgonis]|uniref:Uncharacterized protein n=1 Tax=Arthrobacter ginkgonis TaxID=1630594 RepID=A0ABP7CBY1_9MICC